MSDLNQVIEVVQKTAFNVAGISEQLGLCATRIGKNSAEILQVRNDLDDFKETYTRDREAARQRERVEAEEVQEYSDAISNRVSTLLRQRDRFDLYGSFCKRCWWDAKKHSALRGRGGIDTRKMFHLDVIAYINSWEPYGCGTEGYIRHLDSMPKRS